MSGAGSGGDGADERGARVESPCVKTCLIHPTGRLCVGCLRTIDEISAWGRMGHEERRAVMAALPSRAAILAEARSGAPRSRRERG
jgi:uncharacterized protein